MIKEKPILIQGAMQVEIKTIIEELQNVEKQIIDGYEFYTGTLDGYPVVVSKTEVGLMKTSVSTVLGIKQFSPCMIFNQGIAGGLGKEVHRGDIVIGQDCFNTNSYITEHKKEGEGCNPLTWKLQTFYDGIDKFEKIEANKDLVDFIKQHKDAIWEKKVVYGTIGSGDCWNREFDRLIQLNGEYGALCTDMETIGVYTMAQRYNIPVVGIRMISDNEILQEEYDRNLANTSQEFVIALCKKWIKEGMQK